MKINIRGDKLVVTKAIKDFANEKISKLDKYFNKSDEIKCNILIKVKNGKQKIEVTIPTSKFTIRAEEEHNDLYAAIDLIIDKLERLIKKNKSKLIKNYKNSPSFEMDLSFDAEKADESKIVKRKSVETKPMSEDEALMQIELLGHDFFVFKNIDEECVSVIYIRKDKSYGIINVK